MHNTITALSAEMAEIMKIDTTLKRMDSLMVASNIKRMGRLELLYTCTANLAKELSKNMELPKELQHYVQADDKNQVIYYNHSDETADKIAIVLKEVALLKELCGTDYAESASYELLLRVLEVQDETVTIITDGAYSEAENEQLAAEKNIHLVTTNLTDRQTDDIMADFEFSENGQEVLRCPGGHVPKNCSYNAATGQCTVSFQKNYCEQCPHKNQCHPKMFKRVSRKTVSAKSSQRAKHQRERSTEEFKQQTRFRNGVETIPSILRRKYNIDKIPVRGLIQSRFFFGCKIGALNIKKFCQYMQSLDKCASKAVVA